MQDAMVSTSTIRMIIMDEESCTMVIIIVAFHKGCLMGEQVVCTSNLDKNDIMLLCVLCGLDCCSNRILLLERLHWLWCLKHQWGRSGVT